MGRAMELLSEAHGRELSAARAEVDFMRRQLEA